MSKMNNYDILQKNTLKSIFSIIYSELSKKQNIIKLDETLKINEDGSIGVAVPNKPITLDEYNEIPEEDRKSDNIVYIVEDYNDAANVSTIKEYSTDQIVVGIWIDKKKIYETVISVTLADTLEEGGSVVTDISSLNIDTLISMKGYTQGLRNDPIDDILFIDNGILYFNSIDEKYVGQKITVTLEYTSSSDPIPTE